MAEIDPFKSKWVDIVTNSEGGWKTVPGMYKIIRDAGENILVDHGICLSIVKCMHNIRVRDVLKKIGKDVNR